MLQGIESVSSRVLVGGVAAVLAINTFASAAPTTAYDADSNVLPNACVQIFEGGIASATGNMSLVDLGGGDLILRIDSQDNNNSPYFEKTNAQTPTTWDVDRATGFSVEWRVRLSSTEATEQGAADLIFGSPDRFTSLRLYRSVGGATTDVIIKSALNNTILDQTSVANPDDFHTFRVDVLGDNIDLFVDNVLVLDNVVDPTSHSNPALNLLRLGDGTGTGDGNYDTQFFNTYQDGVVPEPSSLALLGLGAFAVTLRQRRVS
jgi:hypothetical protein